MLAGKDDIALHNKAWDTFVNSHSHNFDIGDHVRAKRRPTFPDGVVLKLLASGFLVVRWDGDLLETIFHDDLQLVKKQSTHD